MSRFAKLFAANAIAAAGLCSAAVALSASAAADPGIPPVVPGVPALNMIQQFANPAGVGAVLQTAATALNGASTLVGAPAPNTLPVSPIEMPGTAPVAPLAPVNPLAPLAPVAPVAQAPAPVGVGQAVGPLLNQLGFPANLVGLGPSPAPLPAAPVAAPLPAAPAAPTVAVINPLPLLNALP